MAKRRSMIELAEADGTESQEHIEYLYEVNFRAIVGVTAPPRHPDILRACIENAADTLWGSLGYPCTETPATITYEQFVKILTEAYEDHTLIQRTPDAF